VEESGHRRDGSRHSKLVNAFKYICSYTAALVKCNAALPEFLIPSGPLLHQRRGKRAGQTKDQTEEPQHIDPDSGCCWFEWLTTLRGNAREGPPIGYVDKLFRYLSKKNIRRIAGIRR
jgi:hypothetical protein